VVKRDLDKQAEHNMVAGAALLHKAAAPETAAVGCKVVVLAMLVVQTVAVFQGTAAQ
jgi:hypothetical protein